MPGRRNALPARSVRSDPERRDARVERPARPAQPGNRRIRQSRQSPTHVVQHTLLVKPSKQAALQRSKESPASGLNRRHDELVIRWREVPAGTTASLYFPEWDADEIIALGAARPGPTVLQRIDAHTVGVTVGGTTYVPIPGRIEKPCPGLLTLELPPTVRTGQRYTIDVHQHAGPTLRRATGAGERLREYELSARKVLGSFRLTIAVQHGEQLLAKQVRDLAVLKYIHQTIPSADSWHPVFVRYIGQLSDKVRGLGVDPDLVPASADDPGIPRVDAVECFTGKIGEVFFDCFGELEGFEIETCSERVRVRSHERRIGELAWKACAGRRVVTVHVRDGVLRKLIVRAGWPRKC